MVRVGGSGRELVEVIVQCWRCIVERVQIGDVNCVSFVELKGETPVKVCMVVKAANQLAEYWNVWDTGRMWWKHMMGHVWFCMSMMVRMRSPERRPPLQSRHSCGCVIRRS